MKVQSVQNNKYTPRFSSWRREVYRPIDTYTQELKHRNNTCIYRDGSLWHQMCKFFVDKFKDVPKVNIYNYACSNGSEPYTFLMHMIANFPEEIVKKFTPIIAKDYDKTAIKIAQSKELPIDATEYEKIQFFTNNQFERFFGEYNPEKEIYIPSNELTDKIHFSTADIRHDYKTIEPENSIVFARNFWPYLTTLDMIYLARNMGKHLKEGSFLVRGYGFDNRGTNNKLDMHLFDSGFKSTKIEGVMEKSSKVPYSYL